jgi:hypothetical protein
MQNPLLRCSPSPRFISTSATLAREVARSMTYVQEMQIKILLHLTHIPRSKLHHGTWIMSVLCNRLSQKQLKSNLPIQTILFFSKKKSLMNNINMFPVKLKIDKKKLMFSSSSTT